MEPQFDRFLRDLIHNTGLSLKTVAHNSGMTADECLSWWSGYSPLPESFSVEQLSGYLGLHKTDFLNDRLDIKIISERINKPWVELPERYAEAPLSFVSSSRHIFEVIRLQHGREKLYEVATKLKVPMNYFQDVTNRINLKFFEDLLKEFIALAGPHADLSFLSNALFISVEDSPLKKLFCATSSYEEAFQQICNSTASFDLNFQYKFSISKSGVEITTKPSEALADSMKDSRYGSEALYLYRSTLFGNMAGLCGLKPIELEVKSCISLGDDECKYLGRFH